MSTETTTLKTYDPSRAGHGMGERADAVGSLLFDKLGEFVTPERLVEASGLGRSSVGWRVFQLRCEGWVIENAAIDDRAAFARGERGWRLVDMAPISEEDRLAWGAQKIVFTQGRSALGRAVFHGEHGEGRVRFERVGFPMISVQFEHGVEKVTRAEVVEA